ncbi:nuclear transport factor 2 family protein [Streptomyces sp. NPDC092369]|uniref:nuclear transport factor 2 family protein n=1 Tax=Streptomyces sp. NPDC092369 TaxID=3366015 RepID=UPI003801140B
MVRRQYLASAAGDLQALRATLAPDVEWTEMARYTAVNKATGKSINVRVAHHFVVRGALIVRFEQFVDTALVRDAMSD